ncbi:hypothetical protein JCM8208_004252 [Rhodotorula glutinis]
MASPLGPPTRPSNMTSPAAAPPTPQEIERKLGSPSLPPTALGAASPSLAALSTSLESSASNGAGFGLLERRGSLASRRTSMISSPADDESDAPHDPPSSSSLAAFAASGGAPLRTSPPSFTTTATSSTTTTSSSSHPNPHHSQQQHHLALQSISETDDALGGASDAEESDASSLGGAHAPQRSPALGAGAPGRARTFDLAPVRTGGDASAGGGAGRGAGGAGGEGGGLSDNVALRSGYLMKKGERRKAWKKRWFVLRGGQLAMYKSDKEYRLLRLIPLSDIHAVAPISLKKHQHAFGIVTPRRTYYVHADSAPDAHDWCRVLDGARTEYAARATVNSVETPRGGGSPAETPRQMSFSGGARPGSLGGAAGRGGRGGGAAREQDEDDEGEDEGSEGKQVQPAHGLGLADDGGATTPRALAQQQAYEAEYAAPGSSSAASRAVNIPGSSGSSLGAAPAYAPGPAPGSSYASTAASSSYSTGGVRAPPNSAAPAAGGSFPPPSGQGHGATEDWSAGLDARLSQLDLGGLGAPPPPSSSSSGNGAGTGAPPSLSLAPVALTSPALHSPLSPPIPMPSTTSSSTSSMSAPTTAAAAAPRPPTARRPSARSDTLPSVPELPFAHALAHHSGPPPLGSAPGRARDRSGSSATRLSVSPSVGGGGGGGGGASGLSAMSSSEEDEPLYVEAQQAVPVQGQPQGQGLGQGQGALGAPFVPSSAPAQPVQQIQQAPPPPDDPNKVILAGYLMKQGKRKNWRKRWFVLQSGMLMYSRSHMDTKHSRQIPLSSIVDAIEAPSHPHFPSSPSLSGPPSSPLSPPTSSSTSSPHDAPSSSTGGPTPDNTFKIITPSRTYLVCAPSEEDEIKWLAALQCLVARRTAQALQPPPPVPAPAPAVAAPAQQPEVVRRPSQAHHQPPQRPQAHGRQRSVTDAARQAVRDVERRFHPGSYSSHGQSGAAAA